MGCKQQQCFSWAHGLHPVPNLSSWPWNSSPRQPEWCSKQRERTCPGRVGGASPGWMCVWVGGGCQHPQEPRPEPPLSVVTPYPPYEPEESSPGPSRTTRSWKPRSLGGWGPAVRSQAPGKGMGDSGSTPGLNAHVDPASEPLSPPPCPHLSLSLCHNLAYFLPCRQFSFGKMYNKICHFNHFCLCFIGV